MPNVYAESDQELEKQKRRAREAAIETRSAAFRAGAIWIPVGPILCVILLVVLKKALISAQELATEQAGFPTEPFMPLALFAALGACYGAFVAWRVTNSSGAVGMPVLMIAAVCMFATFGAGAIASFFIFDGGVPMFAWLSVGITAAVGLGIAWLTNYALSGSATG
jgi:hypothetical protein